MRIYDYRRKNEMTVKIVMAKLPLAAIKIGVALVDMANGETGAAWPSIATLTRKTGLSESAVHRGLRALKAEGWFNVWDGEGQAGTNRYIPNWSGVPQMAPSDDEERVSFAPLGGAMSDSRGCHFGQSGVPPLAPNPNEDLNEDPKEELIESDERRNAGADRPLNHDQPLSTKSEKPEKAPHQPTGPHADSWPNLEKAWKIFWDEYPRRHSCLSARNTFDRIFRRPQVSFDDLMNAVVHYAQSTDPKFQCNPQKWLLEEKWNDEPIKKKPISYIQMLG